MDNNLKAALERKFKTHASSVKNENFEVVIKSKNDEISVCIDFLAPTNDRPNRRSSKLIFIYPREFIEDHTDILKFTPFNKIEQIIKQFNFDLYSESSGNEPPSTKYVIDTDLSITIR